MKDKGSYAHALEWFARAKEGGLMTAVENAANIHRDEGDFLAAYNVICESLFDQSLCDGDLKNNHIVALASVHDSCSASLAGHAHCIVASISV